MYGCTSVNVQDRNGLGELGRHCWKPVGGQVPPMKAPFQVLVGAWPEMEAYHILLGDKGLKGKKDRKGGRRKRFQDSITTKPEIIPLKFKYMY